MKGVGKEEQFFLKESCEGSQKKVQTSTANVQEDVP